MGAIVAADLVYSFSIKDKKYRGPSGYEVRGTITVGNSSNTVPTGGLPLTKGKMGLPRFIRSLRVLGSSASGYLFEYLPATEAIKLLVAGTGAGSLSSNTQTGNVAAPTISLINAGANAAANQSVWSNAGVLSHNVANATGITGVQAPAFTGDAHSHVFTGTATGVATKFSATTGAIASMVLDIEALGY